MNHFWLTASQKAKEVTSKQTTGKQTKVEGEKCERYNKLLQVTQNETHCWPWGYFQLQYRPSRCITVKPVMSSLCWPVCLTEGAFVACAMR